VKESAARRILTDRITGHKGLPTGLRPDYIDVPGAVAWNLNPALSLVAER
jgi:hypothetical protein